MTIASKSGPVDSDPAGANQKALAKTPWAEAPSATHFHGARTLTHAPDDIADPAPASRPVLVVGLNGTLLKSDMLHERLWSALAQNGWGTLRAIRSLSQGRAALQARLAEHAQVDVATLPYDAAIRGRLARWRAEGGRTALVTVSDQPVAEAVAAHLDLFDEVYGSDTGRHLDARGKAQLLDEQFGRGGYDYIGTSAADLEVWAGASRAISVGAAANVRSKLDAGPVPAEHIDREGEISAFVRAIRPQQWLKNLLVLVPLIAAPGSGIFALAAIIAAFFALSLAASAGYLINDLLDLRDDRSHPRKRDRPFASGALSTAHGTLAIPVLLFAALILAVLVSPALLAVVVLYFAATVAYSVKLKQHTMLDICLLAFLFTLRIIAGGVAIGSGLSVWLLAFSMFIFYALAAVKRLAELTDTETAGRETSRRGYLPSDRRIISQMAITSGYLAVLVLALYVDEPTTQEKFSTPWLLWGICPLLIFWISRMVLVADRGEMHDDPMVYSITNSTSRLVIVFCGILMAGAMVL